MHIEAFQREATPRVADEATLVKQGTTGIVVVHAVDPLHPLRSPGAAVDHESLARCKDDGVLADERGAPMFQFG